MPAKHEALRDAQSCLCLPDEQLEYWAEAYRAMPHLARRGVTFDVFLAATPQVREHPTHLVLLALRFRLDERARTLASLAAREPRSPEAPGLAGTRPIEKLRHHRYPRGAQRGFWWRSQA